MFIAALFIIAPKCGNPNDYQLKMSKENVWYPCNRVFNIVFFSHKKGMRSQQRLQHG
jgi:hypothetical protein